MDSRLASDIRNALACEIPRWLSATMENRAAANARRDLLRKIMHILGFRKIQPRELVTAERKIARPGNLVDATCRIRLRGS
jgi:hypothetical protein